jgi:hypothetical protein
MGFFSKIWKGVKKGFKAIGKGIKSAAKKVGKFMDKIGVVGQIALSFILPGIGGMLSKGVGLLAGQSGIIGGIGKVLQTAGKFANTVGNAFKTVTDGIFSFVKTMGGTMVNKLGNMFGVDKLVTSAPDSFTEGFQKWMRGVGDDFNNITSPWREASEQVTTSIDNSFESSYEWPVEDTFTDDITAGFDEEFVTPQSLGEQSDSWTFPTFEDGQVAAELSQTAQQEVLDGWKSYAQEVGSYATNALKSLLLCRQ